MAAWRYRRSGTGFLCSSPSTKRNCIHLLHESQSYMCFASHGSPCLLHDATVQDNENDKSEIMQKEVFLTSSRYSPGTAERKEENPKEPRSQRSVSYTSSNMRRELTITPTKSVHTYCKLICVVAFVYFIYRTFFRYKFAI